ncbi:hypothetical protein F4813DRAFT_349192 [Daldinia decipiens]|uniref:uncharacterized protein n=1 Tax=Daldinia decipiens TaxID=326647 RepID=UPI0020C28BDF|nr:uncharacterized protein F4813DRAFT_349192 [Daldinia decipiens]KAI1660996.1 hypothetical protein F4813DRAFT_349192 [Daldinia decipiens]
MNIVYQSVLTTWRRHALGGQSVIYLLHLTLAMCIGHVPTPHHMHLGYMIRREERLAYRKKINIDGTSRCNSHLSITYLPKIDNVVWIPSS